MNKRAFSLVELLMVVALFSVIMGAAFSFFFSGKKVYQHLNESNESSEKVYRLFQVLDKDLERMIHLDQFHLASQAGKIYWYRFVDFPEKRWVKVNYIPKKNYEGNQSFDDIYRFIETVNEEGSREELLGEKKLLDSLSQVSWGFLRERTEEDKEEEDSSDYIWDNEWRKEELPYFMKLSFEREEKPYQWVRKLKDLPVDEKDQ